MKRLKQIFTFIAIFVCVAASFPESEVLCEENKGLAIAVEADLRDKGFGDSEEIFTMTLRDNRGNARIRQMRVRTLERLDDGDRTLSIFDEPADVKGTALLTYSHGLESDDQWLYLPALKRVKRISSKKKSGPFMGSEFAFEDFSSQEIEKFTYKYLRNEPLGELECFVSEWVPAYEHSGYTRQIVWHDTLEYRVHRIDYYDRRNKLLKTLLLKDYQQFKGKYWRAMRLDMENHKTGKSTQLVYDSYSFGLGLTERDFDQQALKRAK